MVVWREKRDQILDVLKERNRHLLDDWLVMRVKKSRGRIPGFWLRQLGVNGAIH